MHMEADFEDFEILAFGIFFFFFLLVIYKKTKLAILNWIEVIGKSKFYLSGS